MILIRTEQPEDIAAIRRVNERAFDNPLEANLVDLLRERGKITLSLVAVHDAQVVGHILFSPVVIEAAAQPVAAVGLAPMAVLPEWQRQGVGSRLVRAGLDECRRLGHRAAVVLGHANYYPRFGFVPASRYHIGSEYDVPDEVFMAMELQPGALADCAGIARYQPEFNEV
ncbi:MAG TPA: N-acetyltransferase [Blastocatellia bacterium]|nr:N-acetyltransferase [Blastocatellia bacterium]